MTDVCHLYLFMCFIVFVCTHRNVCSSCHIEVPEVGTHLHSRWKQTVLLDWNQPNQNIALCLPLSASQPSSHPFDGFFFLVSSSFQAQSHLGSWYLRQNSLEVVGRAEMYNFASGLKSSSGESFAMVKCRCSEEDRWHELNPKMQKVPFIPVTQLETNGTAN